MTMFLASFICHPECVNMLIKFPGFARNEEGTIYDVKISDTWLLIQFGTTDHRYKSFWVTKNRRKKAQGFFRGKLSQVCRAVIAWTNTAKNVKLNKNTCMRNEDKYLHKFSCLLWHEKCFCSVVDEHIIYTRLIF